MFGFFFGWRKASKCKKLIKQVQCRLKLLKNKKGVITKQLREDVVQLIRNGYHLTAFNRVEQIVKDESRMAAYEMLDNFCEFILLNLSYIRKHKDCPNDVNEAVSSLIFASARCGDLPELQLIRKLFGERYGPRFETTAVELTAGNLVNCQIKEKLLTNYVSDDDKQRMINEIATNCLQPQILALEYRSDWHQNQALPRGIQVHDDEKTTDQHKKQPVFSEKTKREHVQADSTASTSCESLPQFSEERIVYLDDVVELCSSTTTEGDQRLFKFKTAPTFPKTQIKEDNYSQIQVDKPESLSDTENSSSKQRFLSQGKPKTEEIECVNQIKGRNFSRSEGENWGSEGATDKEMEWANFYKKPKRRRRKRRDLKSTTYDDDNDVFNSKSKTVENYDDQIDLSSSIREKRDTLYSRAVTLPPERPKESKKVNFSRTNSCPYNQPSHVHPKLPDYDDIAAKFMALKREHLQNNTLKL